MIENYGYETYILFQKFSVLVFLDIRQDEIILSLSFSVLKNWCFFSHYFSWMKWKAISRESLAKKLSENFLTKPVEPVSEKIIIGSFFIGILSFASFLISKF